MASLLLVNIFFFFSFGHFQYLSSIFPKPSSSLLPLTLYVVIDLVAAIDSNGGKMVP
jgi:hypothetical protein